MIINASVLKKQITKNKKTTVALHAILAGVKVKELVLAVHFHAGEVGWGD